MQLPHNTLPRHISHDHVTLTHALHPAAGKMLLYGVLFSCLDPVLTVACCMAYRCARLAQPNFRYGCRVLV